MEIKEDSLVLFHYEVEIEGDGVVDSTYDAQPLEIKFGENMLLPAMEAEMLGLKKGDVHEFTLTPEKAFGHADKDAVVKIPKANIELRKDIQVGMYMDIEDQQKNEYRGLIVEIDDENITMDFNHPLVDKTLKYKVEILKVS
jgi:FKBP-type peptidyl-prolyl cis-trans isomerase SlpA